jgi:AraC-like DNA-binding protein
MEWFGFNEITLTLDSVVTSFIAVLIVYILIVVFKRKPLNDYPSILLKFLLFVLLFIHIVLTIRNFGLRDLYLPLLFFYYPSFFLIAPVSYMYVCSVTTENFDFSKKKFFHFMLNGIQFLIYIVLGFIISINYFTENTKLYEQFAAIFIPINQFFLDIFFIIYLSFYALLSIRQYMRYRKKMLQFFSFTEGVSMRWLNIFIVSYILYLLILVLVNGIHFRIDSISHLLYDSVEFINTVVFLVLIGVFGSKQDNTYSKYNLDKSEDIIVFDNESANAPAMIIHPKLQDEIISNLEKLMSEEKIFTKTSLTLFELANELNTNRSYLSKVINDNYKINFHTFINNYRVEEVKQCLIDKEFDKFNLDGIAEKCGFVSSSALCKVFKKVTGETPSQYKNSVRKGKL